MHNFTPYSSLLGGIIIGSSVILFFLSTGRMAGISGILANVITTKKNRVSNLLFLLGLVIGPACLIYIKKIPVMFEISNSYLLICLAGFLVGLGTRMSGGCTSGHGICGISRFSKRSIIATLLFILTGMITVFILQIFGFYL